MTSDVAIDAVITPYKGLANYIEADAAFFFGREREREVIVANLKTRRLTLLYGASGVGKSSLLRAGVAAHLVEQAHENLEEIGTAEFIPVVFSAWSNDPLTGLAEAIRAAVAQCTRKPMPPTDTRRLGLVIDAAAQATSSYLLIVLDQFEEYFLYHPHEEGEVTFAGELAAALTRDGLQASFMISIREDALAKLDRFKRDVPKLFDTYLRVSHLDSAAAREAIERPVERHNSLVRPERAVSVQPGLVDDVISQVRSGQVVLEQVGHGFVQSAEGVADGDHIETPYLQLVMTRLWDAERAAGSRVLRVQTLEQLGGAQEIVRTHLDASLSSLSVGERDVAADLFHHLVTPSGTKIAHAVADLADYTGRSKTEVSGLLDKLAGAETRIVRPVPPPPGDAGPPRFEIFHDVLAPAILDWRTRQTATRTAEAKRRAAEAANRRRLLRGFAAAAVVAFGLMVVLAVLAVLARNDANRQRERATAIAESREIATQSLDQLGRKYELGVLLAVAAWDRAQTGRAQLALRKVLATSVGRLPLYGSSTEQYQANYSPDGTRIVTTGGPVRLWNTATRRPLATLTTAGGAVSAVTFSGNGKRLVTASNEAADVWDTEGRRLAELPRIADLPPDVPRVVALNHDGSLFATLTSTGAVQIWDIRTGALVKVLSRDRRTWGSLAFTPGGNRLWSLSGGTVRLWDVASGRLVAVLRGAPIRPRFFVRRRFSRSVVTPDGTRVFVSNAGRKTQLLELPTLRVVGRNVGHEPYSFGAFSSDSERLVTVHGSVVKLWDARTGRLLARHDEHQPITAANFSPRYSDLLLLSLAHGGLRLWDVHVRNTAAVGPPEFVPGTFELSPSGKSVLLSGDGKPAIWPARPASTVVLGSSRPRFLDAALTPQGSIAATAGEDGTVHLWQTSTGRRLRILHAGRRAIVRVAFSPDGHRLLAAGKDGTARLWSVPDGTQLASMSNGDGPLSDAAFGPKGRLIATGGRDGRVSVWIAGHAKPLWSRRVRHGAVLSVAFNATGQAIVTAHRDHTAGTWRATTGERLRLLRPRGTPSRLSKGSYVGHPAAEFSPKGSRVLMVGADGTMRLWDESGHVIQQRGDSGELINRAVFSLDGRRIAAGSDDGAIHIYDGTTGAAITTLRSGREVSDVEFNADATIVLGAESHGAFRTWNLATAEEIGAFRNHVRRPKRAPTPSVRFTVDGRRFVSVDDSGTARVYACPGCVPANKLAPLVRQKMARSLTPAERHRYIR